MSDDSTAGRLKRAREFSERTLSIDELRSALSVPIADQERANAEQLIAWFTRRYATPLERLSYVRCAYARWVAIGDAVAALRH
jgi:hypothetical protein